MRRVGEVERVQRVDLMERDDVAVVADEAHGVDALALAEPADLADLRRASRHSALSVVRYDWPCRCDAVAPPCRRVGRDDAQHALELRQRPLVEQVARHRAAAEVGRLRPGSRCRTRWIVRLHVACLRLDRRRRRQRPVCPALGRDVKRRRRRVDDAAVGHHGGRVDGSSPFARSIVITVSMPSPEKPIGRRTSRHWTIACARLLAEVVGRNPRLDARRCEHRRVASPWPRSARHVRRRRHERQRRSARRGRDDADCACRPAAPRRTSRRASASSRPRATTDRRRRSLSAPSVDGTARSCRAAIAGSGSIQ